MGEWLRRVMGKAEHIVFTVPGLPKGQGRPRFARIGKGIRPYKHKKDEANEGNIQFWFMDTVGRDHLVWTGPIILIIHCTFPRPKSKPKWWQAWKWIPHTGRPDLSNIIKGVEDALNKLAWKDDAQIFRVAATKVYVVGDAQPKMEVTLAHYPHLVPRREKK